MKSRLKLKIIFALGAGILTFSFLILNFGQAQNTVQSNQRLMVSWQAASFSPSWYQGKIFPTKGTPIQVSFELIDNNKIADLSKTIVRWYLDGNLVRNENNGLGIKRLNFIIPDYAGSQTQVKISIVNYLSGNTIERIITIPVVRPEVAINAPYADNKINSGVSVFEAIPFFFNTASSSNLTIAWSTNEQQAAGNTTSPWLLGLNVDSGTPSGTEINLSASVKNILNQAESINKSIKLQVR